MSAKVEAHRMSGPFRGALIAGALSWILPQTAMGADDIKLETVRFPAGQSQTTVKGSIKGRASVSYQIGAEADQTLSIELSPSNKATYFTLYEPGRGPGDEALASGETTTPDINRFTGRLPSSGVYTVNVFLYRAAARRNERSAYRLRIAVTPKIDTSAPVKNDFADGLQGGPDFWVVAGLRDGALRARVEPSAAGAIVARFRNGTVLRNAGCRMIEGGRWCKIALPDEPSATTGWVDGRYLRESAPPHDALVAGTPFHATGVIPCAQNEGQPTRPCRFGVVREGAGKASVTVFYHEGRRVIRFDAGVPASSDASGSVAFKKNADLFLISIGSERYEIPEAVVTGG
jgi:hypothetical protein